jgi:hypothetical protein
LRYEGSQPVSWPVASERRSADLYRGVADAATGERREVLTELAAVEPRHAAHWAAKLAELGEPVPPADRPGVRTAVPSWLARRFSVDAVLPNLERAEHADAGLYQGGPDAAAAMAVTTPGLLCQPRPNIDPTTA